LGSTRIDHMDLTRLLMPQVRRVAIVSTKHFVLVRCWPVSHPSMFSLRVKRPVAHAGFVDLQVDIRAVPMPAPGLFHCRHRAGSSVVVGPAIGKVSITDRPVQRLKVVAIVDLHCSRWRAWVAREGGIAADVAAVVQGGAAWFQQSSGSCPCRCGTGCPCGS